jgi:uncharacterized protein YbaP (TraB family)
MPTKTPNPEKSIKAAFDSVALINRLIIETADDKKKANVERNVKHLELMLTKEFFTEALTTEQRVELEACIEAGNTYIV